MQTRFPAASREAGTSKAFQSKDHAVALLDGVIEQVVERKPLNSTKKDKSRKIGFAEDQSVKIIERVSQLKKQFEEEAIISDTELGNGTELGTGFEGEN